MKVLMMLGVAAGLGVAATAAAATPTNLWSTAQEIDDSPGTTRLVSATSGIAAAGKQQVVMETREAAGASGGTFSFTSLGPGPLAPDSGTFSSTVSQKSVVRGGQSVTIFTATSTWKGKRGTFVLGERIEGVDAGNGYSIGTGVWSLVSAKGRGQYAGLIGSGREAGVVTPERQHRIFFRFEGFVTTR